MRALVCAVVDTTGIQIMPIDIQGGVLVGELAEQLKRECPQHGKYVDTASFELGLLPVFMEAGEYRMAKSILSDWLMLEPDITLDSQLPPADRDDDVVSKEGYVPISWLKHTPNFEKCFGTTGKTSVGKQFTKTDGFKSMAAALGKSSKGKFDLKPLQMRSRFATYKTRYTRAKAYEETTGAGVTDEDEANGIYTLQQKLNSMCPWYDKMDGLFGKKSNVAPLDWFDSTQDDEEAAIQLLQGFRVAPLQE
ncbi:Hypothetical protein PHPALM_19921 [Phytophthora palmivora]|uniref:Uncharacterized protein n=1 Tax=Phytophthora palmivora TaxID=4796 RepID=A0A2P4XG56_9STRA|nr:Hypothetical protein PHPALM_19921 [Phytophthora palmivora]